MNLKFTYSRQSTINKDIESAIKIIMSRSFTKNFIFEEYAKRSISLLVSPELAKYNQEYF